MDGLHSLFPRYDESARRRMLCVVELCPSVEKHAYFFALRG